MSEKKHTPPIFNKFVYKTQKILSLNIATIMFGALFLYMAFSAIVYLTSSHVESYQVTTGPLSRNETYTGLAIRTETVVKADSNGYVTYYAREGSKINANGAVFGLSSTKIPEANVALTQEDLTLIKESMQSFSKGYNSSKFNSTYSFKYQLEGNILQYAGVTAAVPTPAVSADAEGEDGETEPIDTVANSQSMVVTLGNQTISKSSSEGIVLYSKDGYEGKTVDSLTEEDFNQNSYHEKDLKTDKTVKAGQDIYTIVTDENWDLIIPLSDKQAAKLADRTAVRVKFLKDGITQSGDFSIIEIDKKKYGKIGFNKGLIRYASDRFLDIELVTNTISGLKIPLSAITTKEFYTIPSSFATVNPDSNETGFMIQDKNKDGKDVTTFVTPTIYASLEDTSVESEEPQYIYYVDKTAFEEGNAILSPTSNSRYIVSESAALEGVYCVNKGYAVFRRIEILDQNEEYAIISKNTTFGLSRYDHIVKKVDKVKEEEILY